MKRGPDTVRAGFTLVELILAVAVLAILVSIVIPRVGWGTMGKVQAETGRYIGCDKRAGSIT